MSDAALRCAVCGAEVGPGAVWPFRCPNAPATGPASRHHVLHRVARAFPADEIIADERVFVAYAPAMLWARFALAHGWSLDQARALAARTDAAVERVDGRGFRRTPYERADRLSTALGFDQPGGVWVKDDTRNVSGSHKARHLMSVLLHLLIAEELDLAPRGADRPRLAIASCGNAALAAAVLARSADWALEVFVPPGADPWVIGRLDDLDAKVVRCPRLPEDPPGDPCVHRFREAVAGGAVPFGVQGPENALCLDGGRTLAWELVDRGPIPDHLYVQVGGGALATSVSLGLADRGVQAHLHAVQTEGCAPLARAWRLVQSRHATVPAAAVAWGEYMWAWEEEPHSAATGILDDETYDWVGIADGLARSHGSAPVASEAHVLEANRLASDTTSIDADATGTAGLAGLLAERATIGSRESVAVLFTGERRGESRSPA